MKAAFNVCPVFSTDEMMELSDLVVLKLDTNQIVTSINSRGALLLDLPAEQIIGQSWFDFFVANDKFGRERAALKALLTGSPLRSVPAHIYNVRTGLGDYRSVAWTDMVIIDDACKPIGTISFGLNVTGLQKNPDVYFDQSALRNSYCA